MRITSSLTLVLALAGSYAQAEWDISKVDLSKLPSAASTKGVTFAKDIRPIFEASCVRCHGTERQKGELRLDTLESVLKGGHDGKVVVAGDSKKSLLLVAVAQIDDEMAMPPKRGPGGRPGGGPGGPGNHPPSGPGGGNPPPGGPGGGPGGPGGPGGGGFGPPPKPLTPAQVGLVRAWIEQGAK